MARIYRITVEPVGAADTDEEKEFLSDFILEGGEPEYYADEELLEQTIEGWRECGKEPPESIVKLLREQIGNGDFSFTVAY